MEKTTPPGRTTYTESTDAIRATGNEPPWIVTIENDQLTVITEYGDSTQTAPILDTHQGASVTRYRVEDDEFVALLSIHRSVCNDSMTGMPHPYSATLANSQGVLHGCAGQPSDLLSGHPWEVLLINGITPLSGPSITIRFFPENGNLTGFSSCNQFHARFTLTGESLHISRIAGTKMLCSEDIMAQEQDFHRVLSGTVAFDIDADGMLELRGNEGQLLARPLMTEK